ncbi:MAG: hypothetical protein ACKO6F_04360 [Cyanobium sp.]
MGTLQNTMKFSKLVSTGQFSRAVILLLLISVVGAILFDLSEGIKKGLLGFWIIVPPLWLWFEFCFLFAEGQTPFANDFEKFKYGQELTKNLWLSISALLLLVYFGKLPGF